MLNLQKTRCLFRSTFVALAIPNDPEAEHRLRGNKEQADRKQVKNSQESQSRTYTDLPSSTHGPSQRIHSARSPHCQRAPRFTQTCQALL